MTYFAASTDSPQKNREFAESLGADFPILADPGKETARAYGVLLPVLGVAKRWTFYISRDGKILAIDRDVKVESAGDDVAARLAGLGVARREQPPRQAAPPGRSEGPAALDELAGEEGQE